MQHLKTFTPFFTICLLCVSFVFASGSDVDIEEFISKHKARIEKAAPDDWKTFADCANALISRRIAAEEVLQWIDQSIKVKETIYNRTIKGDFLVVKGKIKEAQAEYVRAIELARETNKKDEIPGIQWKILISMGIENYNNFHTGGQ